MGYPANSRRRVGVAARSTAERVEALLGERRNNTPEQQAVTRAEPAGQGTLALKSANVTAAPTAAEHNALVEDMRALAGVLNAMGAKITWS